MRRSRRDAAVAATAGLSDPYAYMDTSDPEEDDQVQRRGRSKAAATTGGRGQRGRSASRGAPTTTGKPQRGRKRAAAAEYEEEDDGAEPSASGSEREDDAMDTDDQDSDADAPRGARRGRQARGAQQQQRQQKAPARGRRQGKGGSSGPADVTQLLPTALDEELLRTTWLRLPAKNRTHKDALMQGYRRLFPRWRLQLRQRFSLLFHGCGSKRALLEAFASEALTDGGVLAVRGHAQGVTSKTILAAVAGALAFKPARGAGHDELLAAVQAEPAARRLYVIIHNIDGPGLRSPEEQLWLGRLAACPNIHLVASVDHVNAALLWDARGAARFRWLWVEAPTYAAYEDETRDTPPLLTGSLQSSSKRGAATVLSTLVTSARAVFRVLAEHQLDDPGAGGASQALLFRMCRERFILNSEQALRSHLVEFRDHELVRGRPGPDGGELLYIPLDEAALKAVLEEMDGGR